MYEDVIHFNKIDHPFYIEVAGISYCDKTYCISRPKSEVTCMEYIISGKGYIQYDNRKFTAEKGDVYILSRGHDQYYYSDGDDPWIKIWFNVKGNFIKDIFNYYKISDINIFKDCPLQKLFDEFLSTCKSGRNSFEIFDECTLIFMRMVQFIANERMTSLRGDTIASKLRNLIDIDISFSQSLDGYCKSLYCTKQYAITVFNSAYGVTPHQYILSRKLITAKNLLKNTNLSISQISEQLNFCDNHYFSTFFKKQEGMTPLQYRKNS